MPASQRSSDTSLWFMPSGCSIATSSGVAHFV
jgi:hypothetical protein